MSEANKQLVQQHFEAIFNRRNLAACAETVAEEYVEHAVAPFGQAAPGKVHGPQHMRGVAEWLLAQFPDLHMTIEALWRRGIPWLPDTIGGNQPRSVQWRSAAHG